MPGTDTHTANGTSSAQSFSMQGPMVALLMPFKPSDQTIDDASFIRYLEVISLSHSQCSDAVENSQPTLLRLSILSVRLQHLWQGGIRNVVVNG